MDRIYIGKEEDRLAVATILVKNKYTVRQSRVKRNSGNTYDYFLEYSDQPPKEGSDD